MIYVSDINKLISEWTVRLRDHSLPPQYRDALFDCCFDLNKLLEQSIEDELASKESFEQWMEKIHDAA